MNNDVINNISGGKLMAEPTPPMEESGSGGKRPFASAFELFSPSKDAVLRNLSSYLVLIFGPAIYFILVSILFGGVSYTFGSNTTSTGSTTVFALLMALGLMFSLVILPAIPYLNLRAAKGEVVSAVDAVKGGFPYFWRILGLSIVVGFAVVIGLILLIIPGLIMLRRYYLSSYYLLDRNVGIFEAMRLSAAESKPYSGAIWGLIGVMLLMGLIGIIPVIGAIISAILQGLYSVAPAIRYLQLKEVHSGSVPVK